MGVKAEIKEVSKKLEKALNLFPQEKLIKTLYSLGIEGIKEKLPDLSKSERELIKDTLEHMKKAVAMDANYAAKYVQGNVYGGKGSTIIQEDKVDDDADEKLVKPEAAKHNHQGDQTPESREENKVEDPKEKSMNKGSDMKGMSTDMHEMISKMKADGMSKMYTKGYGMAKGYEHDDMEKALDKAYGMPPDKEAHMKKAEEDYMRKMHDYAMHKMGENYDMKKMKDDHMKKAENEFDIKKACMPKTEEDPKGKHMEKGESTMGSDTGVKNPEENQVKDDLEKLKDKKARGDKEKPDALKGAKDNKAAQDKVDVLDQKTPMKKSIDWQDDNALLKSGRGGQNHHFSVNDFYDAAIQTVLDFKPKKESLEKSKDTSINGILERKEDSSRDEVLVKSELAGQKRDEARLFKSFDVKDMTEALNMDEKTVKEVLG